MTTLADLAADPIAAASAPVSQWANPGPLARLLAPALATRGVRIDVRRGWTRDGEPLSAETVLTMCRDIAGSALAGLPVSPSRTLERAIVRDAMSLQRWQCHPHPAAAERVDYYSRRLAALRAQLTAEKSVTDPLEPVRFFLIVAAYRLEEVAWAADFLGVLRDVLPAHG